MNKNKPEMGVKHSDAPYQRNLGACQLRPRVAAKSRALLPHRLTTSGACTQHTCPRVLTPLLPGMRVYSGHCRWRAYASRAEPVAAPAARIRSWQRPQGPAGDQGQRGALLHTARMAVGPAPQPPAQGVKRLALWRLVFELCARGGVLALACAGQLSSPCCHGGARVPARWMVADGHPSDADCPP